VQVPKANGQDDSRSKIIAPDILLEPLQLVDVAGTHPIVILVHEGNRNQGARQQVAHEKVLYYHLEKTPAFLQLRPIYEFILQSVQLTHEVGNIEART
jgi:hypothetical protein